MIIIDLQFKDVKTYPSFRDFDPEIDSVVSLLHLIINNACEEDACHLHVSGFGDDEWPVWADVDAKIILEQIPAALLALGERKDFQFDLYEQGVERYMTFSYQGYETWKISFRHIGTYWQPVPAEQLVKTDVIQAQFQPAIDGFLNHMKKYTLSSGWMELVDHWTKTGDLSYPDQ